MTLKNAMAGFLMHNDCELSKRAFILTHYPNKCIHALFKQCYGPMRYSETRHYRAGERDVASLGRGLLDNEEGVI